MNGILSEALTNNTPRINDEFVDGISRKVMAQIPEYINSMIQISFDKLNPNIDLRYVGYNFVSPEEELMEDIYSKSSSTTGDIARNDVYMCKFHFMYNNTLISRPIYFGFCDKGNIMFISGTGYVVMPVLTDLVFSVFSDRIFIKLHSDKVFVTSKQNRIIVNNNPVPAMFQLLYGSVSVSGSKPTIKSNVKLPFVFYLLCRYGLEETLLRYTNITKKDFLVVRDVDNKITPDNPNYRDFDIYSSVGDKPPKYDQFNQYQRHYIKVCIRKNIAMSPMVINLMCGIITVFDMYNGHIETDLVNTLNSNDVVKEIKTWRVLLGRYLYRNIISLAKIVEDNNEMMIALEDYVDFIIRNRLNSAGIECEDFWDLIAYTISIYTEAVNNAKEYNSNINNVYLELLYYICYDMIAGFNKAVKKINQRFSKNGQNQPSKAEINRLLVMNISSRIVYKLVRSRNKSLALAQVDTAHDSLYYKCTALLENQNRGEGVNSGGKTKFPDSIRQLNAYHLVFGSLLYLIKTAPSPTLRMNPWAQFENRTGNIIIKDELKPTVDKLDTILRGLTLAPDEIKDGVNSMLEDLSRETDEVENEDVEFEPDEDNEDKGDEE